jgi:hypothetical protein
MPEWVVDAIFSLDAAFLAADRAASAPPAAQPPRAIAPRQVLKGTA